MALSLSKLVAEVGDFAAVLDVSRRFSCVICRASRQGIESLFQVACGHYSHKSCLSAYLEQGIHLCPRADACGMFLTKADLLSEISLSTDQGLSVPGGLQLPKFGGFPVAGPGMDFGYFHVMPDEVARFNLFLGRFVYFLREVGAWVDGDKMVMRYAAGRPCLTSLLSAGTPNTSIIGNHALKFPYAIAFRAASSAGLTPKAFFGLGVDLCAHWAAIYDRMVMDSLVFHRLFLFRQFVDIHPLAGPLRALKEGAPLTDE